MTKELKRPKKSDFGTKQDIEYQKALNKHIDQLESKLKETDEQNKELKEKLGRVELSLNNSFNAHQCNHYFIQKDTYWQSCIHCGMLRPI